MICPTCGEKYRWYETTCPECHVELVDERPRDGPPPDPDANLVSVFRTADAGLVPLATMALEAEKIEYLIRDSGRRRHDWTRDLGTSRPDPDSTVEILVSSSDASRARELLVDLEQSATGSPVDTQSTNLSGAHKAPMVPPTVHLQDADTGFPIGQISDSQLQFLADQLEEDDAAPETYYIDGPTVELLQSAGADADLVELLNRAVAGGDGVAIRWRR